MSFNAIGLNRVSGGIHVYVDDWGPYTPSAVGKAIVNALLAGSEFTEIGPFQRSGTQAAIREALLTGVLPADLNRRAKDNLTAQYLVEMLRYTGRNGKFYDGLEDGHFDVNVPTPEDRFLDDDVDDFIEQPFFDALTVPQAKVWAPKIGADAIWWDPEVRRFKFGGFYVTPSMLGRIIATTLLRGEEWALIGEIEVTVSYLVQMCREVGKHGRFADLLDDEFDPNVAPDMRDDA